MIMMLYEYVAFECRLHVVFLKDGYWDGFLSLSTDIWSLIWS